MSSVCVTSCRCCVFVTVAILSAVFLYICSLLKFVSDTYGGNVLEYGSCYGFACYEDRFILFPPCC